MLFRLKIQNLSTTLHEDLSDSTSGLLRTSLIFLNLPLEITEAVPLNGDY